MIWTRSACMVRDPPPGELALLAGRPFPFETRVPVASWRDMVVWVWCARLLRRHIFPRWLFGHARHGSEGTFRDDGCLFLEASQAAKPS